MAAMKNVLTLIWEAAKIVLIALLIVVPIRYFLFQPFVVNGHSMEPNYSHGDYLIVNEISYRFNEPARGEVIIFKYPNNPSLRHIKRIIGLPGETIKISDNGIEIISGEFSFNLDETDYLLNTFFTEEMEMSLGEDEFFVIGDNRAVSFDSRQWGALPRDHILGRAWIRVLPFNRAEWIKVPLY